MQGIVGGAVRLPTTGPPSCHTTNTLIETPRLEVRVDIIGALEMSRTSDRRFTKPTRRVGCNGISNVDGVSSCRDVAPQDAGGAIRMVPA